MRGDPRFDLSANFDAEKAEFGINLDISTSVGAMILTAVIFLTEYLKIKNTKGTEANGTHD